MAKDTPVLVMTIMFLMLIGGIMIFGVVENARYSGFQQTAVDKNKVTYAVDVKS